MAVNSATTARDLADVALNGQINESVMQRLFDISNVPLPLTDRIGVGSHMNPVHEWTMDRLSAPGSLAVADGVENVSVVAVNGIRVQNHSQISATRVKVSQRTMGLDDIGYTNKLADAITKRGNEVRRSVEYDMTSNVASDKDTGDGVTAGKSAGMEAWIQNADIRGTVTAQRQTVGSGTSITGGGWENQSGGEIPKYTYTAWTPGAMTLPKVETVAQEVWKLGGAPTLFLSRPTLVAGFSKAMFDGSAKIATLQSDQGVPAMNGESGGLTAIGAVNVFLTDFGVSMQMVASRIMPEGDSGSSSTTALILDPSGLEISYLQGYQTSEIGKLGLTEAREISVDWTLVVQNFEQHGMIQGIAEATAVTV